MVAVPKGYKETEVGVIPEDWDVFRLVNIAPLQRGFDLPNKNLINGKYPVVYSNGILNFHQDYKVYGPGVVTGRSGTIGRVTFVDENYWPHNTSLWVTNFKGNHPKFIYYLYTYIGFERFASGSGVPTLNRNDAHAFEIAIPNCKSEQGEIADCLDNIDCQIKTLSNFIKKKRNLKQGVMQKLLTGEERLPGFSGDWKEKALGDLFVFSGGLSASRDQLSHNGYCYLHYGDIHTSDKSYVHVSKEFLDIPKLNIDAKFLPKKSLLADGDIVFVDASEDDEGVSKHVLIQNPDGTIFISGLHTIVAKSKDATLVNNYKRYCFQSNDVKRQFRFYAVGTKVTGISKSNIVKIILKFPKADEQTAIAQVLSDMDEEIEALEEKLDKCRQVKQGMMQELLTGKTRLI